MLLCLHIACFQAALPEVFNSFSWTPIPLIVGLCRTKLQCHTLRPILNNDIHDSKLATAMFRNGAHTFPRTVHFGPM